MSELRTIEVCQAEGCQAKGAKHVMFRLKNLMETTDAGNKYPDLRIQWGSCNADCEFGPIVRVNDSVALREVTPEMIEGLIDNPDAMMGEVMHVLENDRETFERIIDGQLW